jgi:hypothetical protein
MVIQNFDPRAILQCLKQPSKMSSMPPVSASRGQVVVLASRFHGKSDVRDRGLESYQNEGKINGFDWYLYYACNEY